MYHTYILQVLKLLTFNHEPYFGTFNETVMILCAATKSKFNLATRVSSGYLVAPTRLVVLITHQGTATHLPFLVLIYLN